MDNEFTAFFKILMIRDAGGIASDITGIVVPKYKEWSEYIIMRS